MHSSGGGPRVCIDSSFAMMEVTLIPTTILQRYTVTFAPGQGIPEMEPLLALRPKNGVHVVLTARSPRHSARGDEGQFAQARMANVERG